MSKAIAVTAAILVKSGKVFAARRKPGSHLAGYWEFPGGKLKSGESPEECLKRELTEEFGITTKVGMFVGESIYDYGTKLVHLMAYQVEHLAGDFQLIDHDDMRWLTLADVDTVEWAPADIPLVEQYKTMAGTAAYYDDNAQAYCDETSGFELRELYKPFLDLLPVSSHILDLGCGSGRDSKVFLSEGHTVTAIDGSTAIAAIAERYLGQPVKVSNFQELQYNNVFDGVWASASLLHCPRAQMQGVLARVSRALRPNGIACMSFKWGTDETVDERGRYFNNYTNKSLQLLIGAVPGFQVVDLWSEAKSLRAKHQKWVTVLVRRVAEEA